MGRPRVGIAVIRSKEKVAELKARLEDELAHLPNTNFFGESNADDKKEMGTIIAHLDAYLEDGTMPPDDGQDGAYYWLTNSHSLLGKDYGVDDEET